eukprot:Skav232182  [mRNA]  locus=scaffold4523:22768:27318:- [translate_table: standard]
MSCTRESRRATPWTILFLLLATARASQSPQSTICTSLTAAGRKLFSIKNEQLHLHEDSLELVEVARDIVAIMGEGRAGKSHLGNELSGCNAFATANTGKAMTDGIDIALRGSQLIMDGEGLNNALAPSRAYVPLIGAALASTLIFVLDGKLSEAGLDMLSGVIAEMQLQHKHLPTRLVLVVNKCTLDYEPQAFEEALRSPHGNRGSREAIASAFSERHFVVVPFDKLYGENYQHAISQLKNLVPQDGGTQIAFDGHQLIKMIRGLAVQLQNATCDAASLHQQIMERFLQSQVDTVLGTFRESLGTNPVEYDPDFHVDINTSLNEFQEVIQSLNLDEAAAPFRQTLRIQLEALAEKRWRINKGLGDETGDWKSILRRGCNLLASRWIGARIVVERRQDLSPFLLFPQVIHLDPPVPLTLRWMWQHFHPELNPRSHDFAAVLRKGQVVAVRVAAPPLPPPLQPPRGNSRHKAAMSVSLRSDAWVAVVSQERGETSVACAGELWDAGTEFPKDQDYNTQEQTRRSKLLELHLLWESFNAMPYKRGSPSTVLLIHHALWLAIFPDGHESLVASCLPRLREGVLPDLEAFSVDLDTFVNDVWWTVFEGESDWIECLVRSYDSLGQAGPCKAQCGVMAWPGHMSPMAPSPSVPRKPRRAKAQPHQLIDANLKDPKFLAALLRHAPTADFLAETLKSRASQDEVFANLVVQSCMQCMPSTPRNPKVRTPTSTPCKRSASTMKSRVRSERCIERCESPEGPVAPRSLLPAFEESPECPNKAARLDADPAGLFDPLPLVLVAQVSSFLTLKEKVRLLGSNRQARTLRDLQCTWQPLVLEAEDCAYILRRIRNSDPLGYLEPKSYPGPSCVAWAEVTEVTVELMEPDRIEKDQAGETLRTQFRKASTMTKLILDPVQELARRLSAGWFAGAQHFRLSNIEIDRMDAGFLNFRRSAFRAFGQVKLEQDMFDPAKYCLCASQAPKRLPSREDGYAMVMRRFPTGLGMSRLLNAPEDITDSEALYLQEHTLMVKTGHAFRSVQRLWHVISESEIREEYDVLHGQLVNGFQVPKRAEVIVL